MQHKIIFTPLKCNKQNHMGEKLSRFITNKISRSELYVEVLKNQPSDPNPPVPIGQADECSRGHWVMLLGKLLQKEQIPFSCLLWPSCPFLPGTLMCCLEMQQICNYETTKPKDVGLCTLGREERRTEEAFPGLLIT